MESRLHFKLHYSKYVMRYQSILKDNKDYGEGKREQFGENRFKWAMEVSVR